MTELKYDPEFPYLVMFGEYIAAKFPADEDGSGYRNAIDYASMSVGRVVDITPKPKIPEDAEFIYWKQGETDYYARKEAGYWIDDEGEDYAVSALAEIIGNAEVTVLVRKGES